MRRIYSLREDIFPCSSSGKQFCNEKYTFCNKNNADSFENMKYSMLQEQEYGVGLPQNRLSNEMNESVLDNVDTMEFGNNSFQNLEETSVVSNLPLLFANGHPTSLEKITLVRIFF